MIYLKIIVPPILLLAIYGVVSYRYAKKYIQIGEGLVTQTVSFEQHPPRPTSRVLFLGDSSAVGVGASRPQESVAGRYGAAFPLADITNIGVSGARVADIEGQMRDPHIVGKHFDLIVLHIGGNDVVHGTKLSELQKQLHTIIGELLKKGDRVALIHGGDVGTAHLFPAPVRWYLSYRTSQLRDIYISEVWQNPPRLVYADVMGIEPNPFVTEREKHYAVDQFHPSSLGYGVWYSALEKALEKRDASGKGDNAP